MRKGRPRSVEEATPAAGPGADPHELDAAANAYEIVVGARLSTRWTWLLEGCTFVDGGDGTTVIRCQACDQAALFGILGRIRDIGAPLLDVRRVATRPMP